MSKREACSPRAAVAFSALSAVTWLRGKAGGLVGRITARWITTGRQKVAADPADPTKQNFPQFGHGSIKLTVLFNDPTDPE